MDNGSSRVAGGEDVRFSFRRLGTVVRLTLKGIPAEFEGKAVYIGFRHFNCTDMFWLNLDDVAISEGNPLGGAKSAPAIRKAAAPKTQNRFRKEGAPAKHSVGFEICKVR